MQLMKKNLKSALSLATASLLATHAATGLADSSSWKDQVINYLQAHDEPWQVEASTLIYSETDGVTAIEPMVSLQKKLPGDKLFSAKGVFDTLTGASPNGAAPSSSAQTFTSPSGKGTYSTQTNEQPKDSFKDSRSALSVNWSQPHSNSIRGEYGADISVEYDFSSIGFHSGWTYDLNQRNTTLTAGFGIELDTIKPVDGVPTAYAIKSTTPINNDNEGDEDENENDGNNHSSNPSTENKQVFDFLAGITQVINRRTLMQWNYSISQSTGYLTDPYKILSVIDDSTGDLINSSAYRYESRPDKRLKQSIYWQTKYRFDRDRVDISYRYLWDDWGITSHTLDTHYQWNFSANAYLEPHIRLYQQSAADFYAPFLLNSQTLNNQLPAHASADLRLAKFSASTIGLKYGQKIDENTEWNIRAEWYQQTGDHSPKAAFGAIAQQDLFPTLNAFILQAGYSFLW